MTEMIRCVSPVDGRVYAERQADSGAEIEAALAMARAALRDWRRTPIAERARLCLAAVDAMLAMRDEIVPELAWQMGRPIRYGAGELRGFEERACHMVAIAEALRFIESGPKDKFSRFVAREPLGLVLVIAPWNYPYLTAVNSVVPALMAGNAVILKHAAQTLLVGERFQQAFDRAGAPQGLMQTLTLTHAATAAIISARQVDQVNITGSVLCGQEIEKAAAGTFTGIGLELGGKDPAYVRADADLPQAIENLVDGSFFNSGQSCCGERIYVQKDRYHDFVDGFVELTRPMCSAIRSPRRRRSALWRERAARISCAGRSRQARAPKPLSIRGSSRRTHQARPISRRRWSSMSITRCRSCARRSSARSSASCRSPMMTRRCVS